MSKILDVLTAPWAIQPNKLLEIRSIYATHLRGEKIDISAVEARLGHSLDNEQKSYAVIDGVAVLPMHGVIAKRMNLFSQISGGASSQMIGIALREAVDDSAVHSIILHIDSPGGTVDGTQALMQQVREARQQKRVVAVADGMMASAAYWIGSAAETIFITDGLADVGSIGVVAAHVDESKKEEMEGEKYTEIYAGKYKRIASKHEPLSSEGRQVIQDQVDYVYSIFVGDVAENRAVSEQTVLENMADGREFIGQQAIDAGLVDGVSTLEDAIATLNADRAGAPVGSNHAANNNENGGSIMGQENKDKPLAITREAILADAPEMAEVFRAEGHAAGVEAGASAERERIQAVEAQALAGHDDLIAGLKFDGKTSGAEAAVAVLNAEREQRAAAASDYASDAPKPAPFAAAPDDSADKTGKDFDALVADKTADGMSRGKAIAAIAAEYPDAHAAYLKKLGGNAS